VPRRVSRQMHDSQSAPERKFLAIRQRYIDCRA
jgi:hypothetical protein